MSSLIKVALASNDNLLLDRARADLAAESVIAILGEAREETQVVALVTQVRPTLLLLDLALPPAGGLPLLPQVRKRSPRTHVLVIDHALDEARALGVAKAGAYGYMLGEAVPVHLRKAVQVMAAGEAWFSRRLTAMVVEELQRLARLREKAARRRERTQFV